MVRTLLLALTACQSFDVSRTLGARCDLSSECAQKCLGPDTDWPGGFCTIACDSSAGCPEKSACVEEAGGICAFTCRDDTSCAFLGAYTCMMLDSHGGGAKVMVCRGG
jgi:hypothetical protein